MSVTLVLLAFASSAPAQRARPNAPPANAAAANAPAANVSPISGVYNGTYDAGQGPTKFKLTLTQQDNGTLAGTYTLSLPEGSGTKEYTCDVKGQYISANGMVLIMRGKWQAAPPTGIDMLGMSGQFDPAGSNGAGKISGKMRGRPGQQFEAIRDADESAKLAGANAAKNAPAAPAPQNDRRSAPKAAAPPAAGAASLIDTSSPSAINGVYTGGYQVGGGQVLTAKLSAKASDDGSLTGLFTFDLPASSGSGSATYRLTGKYVAGNRWPFQFTTVEPVGKPAPDDYAMKSVSACFEPGGLVQGKNGIEYSLNPDRISGPVSGGRGSVAFSAQRDKAASADLDKAMAAQSSAAINPAPAAPVARPAYEGVYNGSYAGKQGTTKFKLTLWMKEEHRALSGEVASTDIAGVLALNAPEGSDTKTYTGELAGMINPQRNLQLTVKRWEGSPPMEILHVGGLSGKFDPDGGGKGVGQISGYISDASSSKFQANRDAAESSKMDIAALTSNVRPGVPGVFNGTYTRENEPPTKFKLTITHNGDGPRGLAGMATIYLPVGSGTQPYTYSLVGALDGYDNFHLSVHDWETNPPTDFKNFKGMGFNGAIVLNLTENTARIKSAPASGSLASFYVPQFEATWDASESAHINDTIAAQKAVGAEEQAAALKSHEQTIKSAQPKELASKDLVRKSRQYWERYQTDMIREVFDGGFGVGMDENKQFQEVFVTFVEMFAAKCPECLPTDHQNVNITWRTNRKFDRSGNLMSEENHDYTVDMDSRFVDGYKRCWSSLTSKGEEIRGVIAAAQAGAGHTIHDMLAITTDMQKFFADHAGKSAAMRQLNENFVRAVNDKASLQQVGEKIDGAEAESDKDVLPGRYARFVDGANAYFRERAKADPLRYGDRLTHDTALCQRLAELYQFGMSREEDYYYANDFAARFVPIMGPREGCPDPAWPRLHPAVEKAIAEVK